MPRSGKTEGSFEKILYMTKTLPSLAALVPPPLTHEARGGKVGGVAFDNQNAVAPTMKKKLKAMSANTKV